MFNNIDKHLWNTFLEPLNLPAGESQTNHPTGFETPKHSSHYSSTQPPTYNPFEIPTQEIPPNDNTPPNAHPYYHFLKDRPVKIETPSPPIQWLPCDTNPNKWYTKSPTPDEPNPQPFNGEGTSQKPRMRVRMPHEVFSPIPMINHDLRPMEEDSDDPTEYPDENTDEENPEEESRIEIENTSEEMEAENPNDSRDISVGGSLTSNPPSHDSVDPYVHYLETLKIRTSSSFPPYQGEIPSEQEQADEIREQNRVADYLYLSANGEYVEYPEPRNHYEMVTLGYRDPPPQYGYPHVIPQSYEEHLDRALRESDDLRKQLVVEDKKKKSMGVKIIRKYKKMARMVKKFTKD